MPDATMPDSKARKALRKLADERDTLTYQEWRDVWDMWVTTAYCDNCSDGNSACIYNARRNVFQCGQCAPKTLREALEEARYLWEMVEQ